MNEDSLRYWLIPILCMTIVIGLIFPYILYNQQTVVFPNAALELDELKNMQCDELTAKNALGSYWTRNNGKFARDKIGDCKDAKESYQKNLTDIRREGTHQEKLDAGFEKLWFGVYDHPDLPFRKVLSIIPIPLGTVTNETLYPSEITVISSYNDTIKFVNEDVVGIWLSEDYGKFGFALIQPNETASIQVSEPGMYGYYSKPWLTGTLTVLEP